MCLRPYRDISFPVTSSGLLWPPGQTSALVIKFYKTMISTSSLKRMVVAYVSDFYWFICSWTDVNLQLTWAGLRHLSLRQHIRTTVRGYLAITFFHLVFHCIREQYLYVLNSFWGNEHPLFEQKIWRKEFVRMRRQSLGLHIFWWSLNKKGRLRSENLFY